MIWEDIVSGVDLEIEAGGTWVRFSRVIKNKYAPREGTFTIEGKGVIYQAHDKYGMPVEIQLEVNGDKVTESFTAEDDQYPIRIDPIIDRETRDRVQTQLKRNAKTSARNTHHPYLLRGIVICGLCWFPYYGSVSRSGLHYQCGNRHRMFPQPKTCSARSVNASTLDSVVWESLCQALSHPDLLISELKKVQEERGTRGDFRQQELQRVERELEKKQRAEERLLEVYQYDDQMTLEQYMD